MWLQQYISLLVRSDSDKCLETKHWTSDAMKHFAGMMKPPVSTARAVDKKTMYFHVDSQIAKLPG